MLQLRKNLCLFLAVLLLAQPVFAEESATEPVQPDIISAVRTVESLPANWSPLTPAAPEKQWLLSMTTAPVYRVSADGCWEPVLAQALPEDVTADYAGTYGIPATARGGYAYRIQLRSDACWEDSTAITAEDYVFSIQRLLEDEENRHNWTFLANAEAVLSGACLPGEEIISLRASKFTNMQEAVAAGYTDFFVDTDGFWGLEGGWRPISDRSRLQDFAMPSGMDERYVSPAYLYTRYLADGTGHSRLQREFIGICTQPGRQLTMEDLGVLATGKFELVLILGSPASASTLMQRLENLYLFRESCWGKDYASSPETYCGYGPFRITAVESERIILEPNLNWWGTPVERDFDRIVCKITGKD